MTAAFTKEQETRIVEIVRDVLAGIEARRSADTIFEIDASIAEYCHTAKIAAPKGESDD